MRWGAAYTAAILFLAGCAATASDGQTYLYDDVDNWSIVVDPTIGNGCTAMTNFEGGASMRIGFLSLTEGQPYTLYLFVADTDWKSLERGKEYPIQVKFGNEEPWNGEAEGFRMAGSGLKGIYIPVTNDPNTAGDFLEEFARERTMDVRFEGRSIGLFSLKGSYEAYEKLVECQRVVIDMQSPMDNGDPFANPGRRNPDDPFAT